MLCFIRKTVPHELLPFVLGLLFFLLATVLPDQQGIGGGGLVLRLLASAAVAATVIRDSVGRRSPAAFVAIRDVFSSKENCFPENCTIELINKTAFRRKMMMMNENRKPFIK